MRVYVFVDAENHYQRSIETVRRIIDSPRAVEALSLIKVSGLGYQVPKSFKGNVIGWKPELQLFWDITRVPHMIARALNTYHSASLIADRVVYVCSCVGTDESVHDVRVKIREIGFEPIIIREPKDLYKQRQNSLEKFKIIEKPKGCDIALVTRMVADAAADLYDCCCLFTSDADFLPAVEAVRRMGKTVIVGGYKYYLPAQSPYLYVPDEFVDLEDQLCWLWRNSYADITAKLCELGEECRFERPE